jgi:pimeloyl-ACP methyl ester carboxylesterase
VTDKLELRVYGDAALPTLVYLPGLHGDWTLVGSFRRALNGQLRFVEMTYPRTLEWSLDDYAAAIEAALAEQGIDRGWLLGESFGSQVLWALVARSRLQIDGLILAGGFVRHPMPWAARLVRRLSGGLSQGLISLVLSGYARVAHFRYRRSPEVQASIREFIARRTPLDIQAANHRLDLIAQTDLRPIARQATVPVYALTGLIDPVVPWWSVKPWLTKNCATLREYRFVWRADHNVLGTGSRAAAERVTRWVGQAASRAPAPSIPRPDAAPTMPPP